MLASQICLQTNQEVYMHVHLATCTFLIVHMSYSIVRYAQFESGDVIYHLQAATGFETDQ